MTYFLQLKQHIFMSEVNNHGLIVLNHKKSQLEKYISKLLIRVNYFQGKPYYFEYI